jgi:ribosome-associated toxin RatA of RatAB toxin-antitoxin module
MQKHFFAIQSLLLFVNAPPPLIGEPPAAAVSAFDSYTQKVESRLSRQHRSPDSFLAPPTSDPGNAESRLRRGEMIIERLTPSTGADFHGALLHHWRGTAFAPAGKAPDFERLLRDFNSYPQHFSPEVLQARVLEHNGDRMLASMRVRQRHTITVVMDATYDMTFDQLDSQHRFSISRSTRITEIASPGTSAEHPLNSSEEHGFLWRLNTFWSFEEQDDGLYLQLEALSLTRSIPRGLGWAIRPYVESIPRESLEFTLRAARTALVQRTQG